MVPEGVPWDATTSPRWNAYMGQGTLAEGKGDQAMAASANPGQQQVWRSRKASWPLTWSLLPEVVLTLLFLVVALLFWLAQYAPQFGPTGLNSGIVVAAGLGGFGVAVWCRALLRLVVPLSNTPSIPRWATDPVGLSLLFLFGHLVIGAGWITAGVFSLLLRPDPYVGWIGGVLVIAGCVVVMTGTFLQSRLSAVHSVRGVSQARPHHVVRLVLAVGVGAALVGTCAGIVNWFAAETPTLFPAYTLGGPSGAHAQSWSPNGQEFAALRDDGNLTVWNMVTRHVLWRAPCHTFLYTIGWSADGSYVAVDCPYRPTGNGDGSYFYGVSVWNALSGVQVAEFPETGDESAPQPEGFAWSPTGTQLAVLETTRSPDIGYVAFYAMPGETLIRKVPVPAFTYCIAWSPDGQTLATWPSGAGIALFSATTGQRLAAYHSGIDLVDTLAWSPDGTYLVASGWVGDVGTGKNTSGRLEVWQVSSGRSVFVETDHTDGYPSLAWSPDGRALAVGSPQTDGVAQVYDVSTWQPRFTWRGQDSLSGIQALAWSPDGRYIASGTFNGPIAVWHPELGAS